MLLPKGGFIGLLKHFDKQGQRYVSHKVVLRGVEDSYAYAFWRNGGKVFDEFFCDIIRVWPGTKRMLIFAYALEGMTVLAPSYVAAPHSIDI